RSVADYHIHSPTLADRLPLFSLSSSFTDTATTDIYTLSLHDALPICSLITYGRWPIWSPCSTKKRSHETDPLPPEASCDRFLVEDRKSTRLNSSHVAISYAVFCLKKKREERAYLIRGILSCQ